MVFSGLVALYLFLGGASAGAFAAMSVLDLGRSYRAAFRPARGFAIASGAHRLRDATLARLARVVYPASVGMLAAGLMCLLADLGKPSAFYLLFLYPTASYMSIGSFALVFLAACMAVSLADALLSLGRAWKRAAVCAKAAGIVFSVAVMAYTGLLLKSVISVPIWQSWWLPALFLASALSCGCATVMVACVLSAGWPGIRRVTLRLAVADAAFIVLEAATMAAYAASVAPVAAASLHELLFGSQAWLFWAGFAACGIVAPLCIDATALAMRRQHGDFVVAAVSTLVLIGGVSLRFALIGVGIQVAV